MKDFSLNQAGKIFFSQNIYLCDPYGFHINMKKKKILLTGNPKWKHKGIPWQV